jgi:cytochrome c-type biogenesis protein
MLSILIAFLAGIVSFLSPCVLPLIPGFIAYLTGTNASRRVVILHSGMYVLGFTLVFATLGVLLQTLLASVATGTQRILNILAGSVIIMFGLHVTGWVRIPLLQRERSPDVARPKSLFTSFLFGASFAVGWSPCVGPILGTVLALATTAPGSAFVMLLAYALGLGLPFLLVGVFASEAVGFLKRMRGALRWFNVVVGVVLIIGGLLILFGWLSTLANYTALLLRR